MTFIKCIQEAKKEYSELGLESVCKHYIEVPICFWPMLKEEIELIGATTWPDNLVVGMEIELMGVTIKWTSSF